MVSPFLSDFISKELNSAGNNSEQKLNKMIILQFNYLSSFSIVVYLGFSFIT